MKRKFTIEEVELEIVHFIKVTKGTENCADYLISQLIAIVGSMSKAKQVEFLTGLINAKQEIVNE